MREQGEDLSKVSFFFSLPILFTLKGRMAYIWDHLRCIVVTCLYTTWSLHVDARIAPHGIPLCDFQWLCFNQSIVSQYVKSYSGSTLLIQAYHSWVNNLLNSCFLFLIGLVSNTVLWTFLLLLTSPAPNLLFPPPDPWYFGTKLLSS